MDYCKFFNDMSNADRNAEHMVHKYYFLICRVIPFFQDFPPAQFCPEHISQNIEGFAMKMNALTVYVTSSAKKDLIAEEIS